jgi:prefoldin subunit 5
VSSSAAGLKLELDPELKKKLEELSKSVQELLKRIEELKKAVQQQWAPPAR